MASKWPAWADRMRPSENRKCIGCEDGPATNGEGYCDSCWHGEQGLEIIRLGAELERTRLHLGDVKAVRDRLRAENERSRGLLDELDRYVGHREDCNLNSGAPECSCGFEDLYVSVRATVRRGKTAVATDEEERP